MRLTPVVHIAPLSLGQCRVAATFAPDVSRQAKLTQHPTRSVPRNFWGLVLLASRALQTQRSKTFEHTCESA